MEPTKYVPEPLGMSYMLIHDTYNDLYCST